MIRSEPGKAVPGPDLTGKENSMETGEKIYVYRKRRGDGNAL